MRTYAAPQPFPAGVTRSAYVDVLGYSYGGLAALNYAIGVPECVKRLVLLSPVSGLLHPSKQFYIRGAAPDSSQAGQFVKRRIER